MSANEPSWDRFEQDLETLREDVRWMKRKDPDELDEDDRRRIARETLLTSSALSDLVEDLLGEWGEEQA